MTAIIDYHAGNIASVQNMLKKIGVQAILTNDVAVIRSAQRIILPGVGSFDFGMSKLKELALLETLHERVRLQKIPCLGICLGAQLMCSKSEEGRLAGLGWISAEVRKFPTQNNGTKYAVPHMGWDVVGATKPSNLLTGLGADPRFYFVHSYFIKCNDRNDVLFTNEYSVPFDSAFERDNIVGVQFHPEKSHKFGKTFLKNFIERF